MLGGKFHIATRFVVEREARVGSAVVSPGVSSAHFRIENDHPRVTVELRSDLVTIAQCCDLRDVSTYDLTA